MTFRHRRGVIVTSGNRLRIASDAAFASQDRCCHRSCSIVVRLSSEGRWPGASRVDRTSSVRLWLSPAIRSGPLDCCGDGTPKTLTMEAIFRIMFRLSVAQSAGDCRALHPRRSPEYLAVDTTLNSGFLQGGSEVVFHPTADIAIVMTAGLQLANAPMTVFSEVDTTKLLGDDSMAFGWPVDVLGPEQNQPVPRLFRGCVARWVPDYGPRRQEVRRRRAEFQVSGWVEWRTRFCDEPTNIRTCDGHRKPAEHNCA